MSQMLLRSDGDCLLDHQSSEKELSELMDRLRDAEYKAAEREYTLRMERKFNGCPGFMSADLPRTEGAIGHVVVTADQLEEAIDWLRKRYAVNPKFELDCLQGGVRIEIMQRVKKARQPGAKRVQVKWEKPIQYQFNL